MKAKQLWYWLRAADRPLMDKYDRWRKTAELLKLSKKAKQKLEWFIYYYTKGQKKALTTCRYFGISKTAFYKWLAVFDETNLRLWKKAVGLHLTAELMSQSQLLSGGFWVYANSTRNTAK